MLGQRCINGAVLMLKGALAGGAEKARAMDASCLRHVVRGHSIVAILIEIGALVFNLRGLREVDRMTMSREKRQEACMREAERSRGRRSGSGSCGAFTWILNG